MKIKLIEPATDYKCCCEYKTKYKFLGFKRMIPPLSLLTLSSFTPSDVEIVITDENVEILNYDEKVDLVGITGKTCVIKRAYEIVDEFRKRRVPVIMGGIHASLLPYEAIQHCDAVVVGEAKDEWKQVVNDAKKKRLKTFYLSKKFPALNNTPLPRYELLKSDRYALFSIQTTRGCPYECDFCSLSVFNGRKCRFRNIQQVLREIELLKKIDANKDIFFCDANWPAESKFAKELMKRLISIGTVKWGCQISINRLRNDSTLSLMYKSGCRWLEVGFESISQKSLDIINKSKINRVKEYKEIIDKVYSYGLTIYGSFVLGNDGEDESIFDEVAKFIHETKIYTPYITLKTPFPGTRLYKNLYKEKRIIHNDWSKYDFEHIVFKPYPMTVNNLQRGWENLIKDVFSYDNLYKRIDYYPNRKLQSEDGGAKYFPIGIREALFHLRKYLSNTDQQRRSFVAKCLRGNNSLSTIDTIIEALSLHDWAYSR